MATIKQVKHALLVYARAHHIEVPVGYSPAVPVWGLGTRKLAWRVSEHLIKHGHHIKQTATMTDGLVEALLPNSIPDLHIIEVKYKWRYALTRRSGRPLGLVHHNAAASHCTAQDVHRWHLARGWSGIAYEFFIAKDGKVYRGRPEWALGGHTWGGSAWLALCVEGNYDVETMPAAQVNACRSLHKYLHGKYGNLKDIRHRDFPNNSTSCPGAHYPFDKIV
jgi:hypothetical protein